MSNISISELRPAGSELFQDSESYLNELGDRETEMVQGGFTIVKVDISQDNKQLTANINNQQFTKNTATTFQNTVNKA